MSTLNDGYGIGMDIHAKCIFMRKKYALQISDCDIFSQCALKWRNILVNIVITHY